MNDCIRWADCYTSTLIEGSTERANVVIESLDSAYRAYRGPLTVWPTTTDHSPLLVLLCHPEDFIHLFTGAQLVDLRFRQVLHDQFYSLQNKGLFSSTYCCSFLWTIIHMIRLIAAYYIAYYSLSYVVSCLVVMFSLTWTQFASLLNLTINPVLIIFLCLSLQ